jgi:hypothetical protein
MRKSTSILIAIALLSAAFAPAYTAERGAINAGALKTELWQNGLMGDTTATVNFPAGLYQGVSLLRLGNLWFGGSVDGKQTFGVINSSLSDLGRVGCEWVSDSLGVVAVTPGSRAPLELQLDLKEKYPSVNQGIILGIKASVRAHQWSYQPADKFYILEYSFVNDGPDPIDSGYAGLWHLSNVFKTKTDNAENYNFAGFDTTADPVNGSARNLLYAAADSVQCQNFFGVSSPFLGLRLLAAKDPNGSPAGLSGACVWRNGAAAPVSDNSILDYRSRYYYLSRGKFDAELSCRINTPKLSLDSLHLKIDGKVLTQVDGVWDINDTSHMGVNYYQGGSFNPASGIITLGIPRSDKLQAVYKEAATATDTMTVPVLYLPLAQVMGVYDNAAGTGTNYYSGGSFVPATGIITLGTPRIKLTTVNLEEDWAGGETSVYVQVTPLYEVLGVYDDSLGTGTNYYSGGSFNQSNGEITLGTAYAAWESAPLYVSYRWLDAAPALYIDYRYKLNNLLVSYKFYHTKTGVAPSDNMNLTLPDPTALQEVAGVYRQSDTLMAGTNYYTGGGFDITTGTMTLGTALPEDTVNYNLRENYLYDNTWVLSDSLMDLSNAVWPDYAKVVEILGVYDNSAGTGTNYFAGGSFDPGTYIVLLGTKYPAGASGAPVYVTYRYLKLTDALVKYHSNDLGSQNMVLAVGPWNMDPNDSAKAVFAVVAGNSLAEIQAASDSAFYIWNNSGPAITTSKGSVSGQVSRTLGRAMVENAVVTAYQGPTAVDSAHTNALGRYFISNLEAGTYDSLVAAASGYLQDTIWFNASITAGQDTAGLDFVLTSANTDLSGHVFRADSSTAVPGVKVYLQGTNDDSTVTNSSGYYSFPAVLTSAGDSLIFSRVGFTEAVSLNLTLQADSSLAINKVLHSTTGWLEGRITKSDSLTPLANAAVSATGPGTAADTTDASGNYSFSGLAAGSYDLNIVAVGYSSQNIAGNAVQIDSTSRADASLSQNFSATGLAWAAKAKMPNWLLGTASCQLGGKIYLFGGRDYALARNTVYSYDPAADTLGGTPWISLTSMPTARYGLGCASVGDSIIYVIGGYNQDSLALSAIEAYKPAGNSWITGLTSMPTPRAFMGVTSIKDSVYAVGGENNLIAGLDTVEIYLASSNTWVTKKALLGGPSFGRTGSAVATLDSLGVKRVYSAGGKKVDGTYLAVNQKYNPVTNAWGTRTSLSSPTGYCGVASVNDSLYLIGGKNGSSLLSGTFGYSPFSNAWLANNNYPTSIAQSSVSSLDSMGFWVLGGMVSDNFISDSIYFGYKPGAIAGRAYSLITGPIAGVAVSAKKGSQIKNSEQTKTDGTYTLAGLEPGYYDVKLYKAGSVDTTLKDVRVKWGGITDSVNCLGIEGKPVSAEQYGFKLGQAYPNPVKNLTTISYQLPSRSNIALEVYNVLGQKVKTLIKGSQNPGWHSVTWNGRDNSGRRVSSGIYLYRLTTGSGTAVNKLVVIR